MYVVLPAFVVDIFTFEMFSHVLALGHTFVVYILLFCRYGNQTMTMISAFKQIIKPLKFISNYHRAILKYNHGVYLNVCSREYVMMCYIRCIALMSFIDKPHMFLHCLPCITTYSTRCYDCRAMFYSSQLILEINCNRLIICVICHLVRIHWYYSYFRKPEYCQ